MIPIELAVGEFELEGGRMFTGTIRDISDQIRMELEIRRSQKLAAVGQLAAGVAHEIGTPLNVISANAEYAIGKQQGSDELSAIVSEVDRISGLVERLMSLARKPETTRQHVDVGSIIRDVVALLHHQLQKVDISVSQEIASGLPTVLASRDEITQVILNLVINAWHAMPEGGHLTIGAHVESEELKLTVEDTGTGIAPEDLDRVFEPFYTTKDVGEGLGLGLSIVHRVVDDCGGRIEVRSTLGEGAVFEVRLPTEGEQSDV